MRDFRYGEALPFDPSYKELLAGLEPELHVLVRAFILNLVRVESLILSLPMVMALGNRMGYASAQACFEKFGAPTCPSQETLVAMQVELSNMTEAKVKAWLAQELAENKETIKTDA